MIRAALFDIGGVITASPFEAFHRHEGERGLPNGSIARVIRSNPGENAWARYERGELDREAFVSAFEREARALGVEVDARACLAIIRGKVRPKVVEAIRRIRSRGLLVGLLTNSFPGALQVNRAGTQVTLDGVVIEADAVLESSRIGFRKPEPRFLELACATLAIEPSEAVFLDDLGTNLKPAREMGMTTIKVVSSDQALKELQEALGFMLLETQKAGRASGRMGLNASGSRTPS